MPADITKSNRGLRILFAVILIVSLTATLLILPSTLEVRAGAIGLLLLLAIPLSIRRDIDIFSPLSILAFSFYFYCFIGPLNLTLTDQIYFYSVDIASQYGSLFLLAMVSLAGALAGWHFGEKGGGKAIRDYSDTTCVAAGSTYSFLAISSFSLYYFLAGTFVDRSRLLPEFESRPEVVTLGYLLQGLDLCLPGLVLLCASGRAWVRRLAYVFGAILLLLALTTGFRANVVKTVFPLFMMAYVRTGRRPSARICAVTALAALIVFAGIGFVRAGGGSFGEAFSTVNLLDRDLLLSDLNTIQAMSLVLAKVPNQADYLWGASLAYIPLHAMPRSLYPDKGVAPEVQLVWDLTDKYAGFALPMFGLFYLNFGYAGAAAGMFVVGWLFSRFYSLYRANGQNRRLQCYFVILSLLSYLTFPRHSLVQLLTQTVYALAPVLLLDVIQFSPRLIRDMRAAGDSLPQRLPGVAR